MTQGAKVLAVAPATAEEERAVARSVETALVLLLNECPYYAHIAHALRLRVTRAVPTAAVSLDMRLFINPDYWEGIGKWRTRAAVLAHEISHVLYAHIERRGVRIPFPWQISSDLEINDNLAVDGWPITERHLRRVVLPPPLPDRRLVLRTAHRRRGEGLRLRFGLRIGPRKRPRVGHGRKLPFPGGGRREGPLLGGPGGLAGSNGARGAELRPGGQKKTRRGKASPPAPRSPGPRRMAAWRD